VLAPAQPARHARLLFRRARKRDAPPRLLLRFAVYAGIALLVAAGAGAWISGHRVRARAEHEVFQDARFTADRLGRDDLAKLALKRPVTPDLRADLDELFGREALGRGVVRVSLFNRQGLVTYSTDHSLIGKQAYDLHLVRQALSGMEVHDTARLRGGFGDNPTVIQSYAPVYWYFERDSSPNGVIGIYRDYGPVAHAIRTETLIRAGTTTGALLFLYLLSLPILLGVTRTLERRNRQLAEQAEALRLSEEKYRLIVETAAEGVALLDADGGIVFANGKLAELLGRSVDDLGGNDFMALMDEHSRATVDPRWFRRRREQREFAFLRPDGTLAHAAISANPIFERDGRYAGALAMVNDITERKHAEETLHAIEARLGQAADKHAAQQAAAIARDFDHALTAITGYSDYLMNRLDVQDPLYREALQLRNSAGTSIGLTRQLLAISRRESLRSDSIDIAPVVQEIVRKVRSVVGNSVAVLTECDAAAGRVNIDVAQLEQVLVNLALFARHSMPDGGRIVISASAVEVDERRALAHAPMLPGSYVLLTVNDTGHPLDAEAKARLFAPLFDESEDSAGLGLATVYGIVKQSEGFIWVEDGPDGRGTTFSVYLPREP
jgi:PAS domain S-box-containing protein